MQQDLWIIFLLLLEMRLNGGHIGPAHLKLNTDFNTSHLGIGKYPHISGLEIQNMTFLDV